MQSITLLISTSDTMLHTKIINNQGWVYDAADRVDNWIRSNVTGGTGFIYIPAKGDERERYINPAHIVDIRWEES